MRLAIFVFMAGLFTCALALHGIDLAWNGKSFCPDCIDTNYWGQTKTITEMYLQAYAQIPVGLTFMMLGFILLIPKGDKYKLRNN